MIIKNYGRFWERDAVNWGTGGQGNRGHLRGYHRARSAPVDFRDQIGIYILYDQELKPVYVGQAGNGNKKLFDRLKQHQNDHLWNRWRHFSWFGFRGVTGSAKLSEHDKITKTFKESGSQLLNQVEGILIAGIEPILNKQGSKWSGATQYFQTMDQFEKPTLVNLMSKLQEIENTISKW